MGCGCGGLGEEGVVVPSPYSLTAAARAGAYAMDPSTWTTAAVGGALAYGASRSALSAGGGALVGMSISLMAHTGGQTHFIIAGLLMGATGIFLSAKRKK
jgi:LPXTG-motif cell wall-anchored protein